MAGEAILALEPAITARLGAAKSIWSRHHDSTIDQKARDL
jgi:hypothetical protein